MDSSLKKNTADTSKSEALPTRRKFLKGGVAAAVGTAAVGFPMISSAASHAKPVVLKLQGAWA
jgi:hypothetical protein